MPPPSSYGNQQQTRQQLDELDALLQRMLSLPMSSAEPATSQTLATNPEEFAPLPPTLPTSKPMTAARANGQTSVHAWRVQVPPPAGPTLASQPGVEELPMAVPIEDAGPAFPAYIPPPPQPRFSAGQPPALPAGMPPFPLALNQTQPVVNPVTAPAIPRFDTGIPVPQWQAPKPTADESVPVILWPLVAFNWLFDLLTYLLGPLGSWLRSNAGRNILGWLGIVMIFGALGWAIADWYGIDWTR